MGIHIGTSGWHYRHWVGLFYPKGMKPDEMLQYYAGEFTAVEVNNSFYRLPDKETLIAWRDSTPGRFVFAFKASRYVTHMKKLKDAREALGKTLAGARVLEEKLGPVLFQLPPRWRVNPGRLQEFLKHMPNDVRVAFEFRDPSWFTDEVYGLLRGHGAAFCIYDLQGKKSPTEVTADFVYVRMHGAAGAYQGRYTQRVLSGWTEAVSSWHGTGKDVFLFFNNDSQGYAIENARELKKMLA